MILLRQLGLERRLKKNTTTNTGGASLILPWRRRARRGCRPTATSCSSWGGWGGVGVGDPLMLTAHTQADAEVGAAAGTPDAAEAAAAARRC